MKISKLSFEKSFGAVIFRRNDEGKIEFLLLKHRRGHWDFPRGHKENDESDEETVRREVQEETGITDIKIMPDFLAKNWFWYVARGGEKEERLRNERGTVVIKRVYMRLAQTETKEVELLSPREQTDFAWELYEDAVKKVTYREAQKMLEKAYKFLI